MRYLFGELEYLLPQSDPYILHPFSPVEYLPYFGKGLSIRFQNKYSIPLPLTFGPRIVKPHRVIVLLTGNFEITSLDEVLVPQDGLTLEVFSGGVESKSYCSHIADLVLTDGIPTLMLKPRDYIENANPLVKQGFLRFRAKEYLIDFVSCEAFFATRFNTNPTTIMARGAYAFSNLTTACASCHDDTLVADQQEETWIARADLLLKTEWDEKKSTSERLDINGVIVYHDNSMTKVIWAFYDEAAFHSR